MVKGGKRYHGMEKDGLWFAHPHSSKLTSREVCTTTGAMLSEAKTLLPQEWHVKRYPKWKIDQRSREDYPLSRHDNKNTLKSSISIFSNGVGRRKYPDDYIQTTTHISLAHESAKEPASSFFTSQPDFTSVEVISVPTKSRRFPRNHKLRSEGAFDETREQLLWFGQDKFHVPVSLDVLATANRSAPSGSSHI
ncbi:testis-expressed protein 36 [Gambusia affinis]|uniref:Domain of unknown function with conserved HDNR motif domain-containing protein n=1 Tax=Gambusia affinis TaxID=33528 RepID=A0A315VR62_GAMAF|nr:testis-expressed protein 36 [Gambusia affinis]PWA25610.1 hypothetical protein CCH79_00001765 [Gambusia affinis]